MDQPHRTYRERDAPIEAAEPTWPCGERLAKSTAMRGLVLPLAALLVIFCGGVPPAQAGGPSYALVQDDASLKIRGRVFRLFGIYIPPTHRQCRSGRRPVQCGSRAALALDSKIQGFVRCETVARLRDGSRSAVCRVRSRDTRLGPDLDLAAYLLSQGWAVALPQAPFQYRTLERIARAQGRGVWGFQADSIGP